MSYTIKLFIFSSQGRSQIRKQIRILIFVARRKRRALPCFLGFVSRVFHQSVAFTSLPSFFPGCWNKKLASGHRYNVRRPLFCFSWPPRRAAPRRPLDGRRTWSSCVLQIKLSWKQTGTTWSPPNKLTPLHSTRTTYGLRCLLFPNSRLIHFSLLLCWRSVQL